MFFLLYKIELIIQNKLILYNKNPLKQHRILFRKYNLYTNTKTYY